ncbi:hypothetical protein [Flindersiella endophytica]
MNVWRWNRVVNALVLAVVLVLLVLLVALWVRSYAKPAADPHGYTLIFGALAGLLLLPPLLLLVGGALLLRRGQRSAFGFQVAAGVVVGLYGVVIPDAVARIAGVGLGAALVAVGVLGLRARVAKDKEETRDP